MNKLNKPKVHIETLRDSDGDWSILRINGEKIAENHSIDKEEVLTWLEDNGIISWSTYDIEGQQIDLDGNEIDYVECPDWVKKAYDEIDRTEDGY